MNLSNAAGTTAIVNHCLLYGGGTLDLRSGSAPATPETAISGTQLALWTFQTPAFTGVPTTSGGFDYLNAQFSASGVNPVATGTAGYARALFLTSPPARANTTAYTRGALITAGGFLWVCIASGTTSGTSTLTAQTYGTIDGTAMFDAVGTSGITAIADFSVGVGSGDIQFGTLSITTGTTVTISSFHIQVAVV